VLVTMHFLDLRARRDWTGWWRAASGVGAAGPRVDGCRCELRRTVRRIVRVSGGLRGGKPTPCGRAPSSSRGWWSLPASTCRAQAGSRRGV
jgi:hypothetical protein